MSVQKKWLVKSQEISKIWINQVWYVFMSDNEVFDNWNNLKKCIQDNNRSVVFKEWDIWWASVWKNIWVESFWKWDEFRRPILIIRKLSKNAAIAIPLTSKEKNWSWYTKIRFHGRERWLSLNQIRIFSVKRFQRRITVLNNNDFYRVKKELKSLLKL